MARGSKKYSTEKYPHLKPAVGVKDSVPNKTREMKNLQTFKSAGLDFQRASEEEQERLDGSENSHSQVEVEESGNKSSELKGSETMCDGSYYKGFTRQRKRGKTDDQQFPALHKGNSDSSCPGS
nr:ankyrin repeat domain-containing protein 26-like isoform X10 [Camelus dromedarius]XP_031301751.1 ankyrin repeat domain-containing protein 26-like isoform X11 [Camelus dromedarius]XP_031301752.1 ankyrin repeat domain-containing protein 26-like isoform X12 [Camelus dromedarius]